MSSLCPNCQSPRVASTPNAKRIVMVVGIVGGAVSGVSVLFRAARAGAHVTSAPDVVLHGLACCVTGYDLATQIAEKLNNQLLTNHRCLSCGHRFNQPV